MALSILDVVISYLYLFYCMVESIVIRLIPIKYRSKDIAGQIALVTGAGGGIGRLLALGLANLGCKVVCWDVAKQGTQFFFLLFFYIIGVALLKGLTFMLLFVANEETARLIKRSNGEVYAYHVDLSKREDVYRVAELVKKEVGKVSCL